MVLVFPTLGPGETVKFGGLQLLVLFTLVGMLAGAYVIWDLGRIFARMGAADGQRDGDVGLRAPARRGRHDHVVVQHDAADDRAAGRGDQHVRHRAWTPPTRSCESTNARLKEFSFKDEVTGLYNRRFFSIRLEEEVSRYRRFNHPVSVVLLDLDGFKAVNDELGHAAGDETLRERWPRSSCKHSRGINVICRYGGDEFAVLLVETSKGGARLYADRIRYVLATHAFAHGRR